MNHPFDPNEKVDFTSESKYPIVRANLSNKSVVVHINEENPMDFQELKKRWDESKDLIEDMRGLRRKS